MNQRQVLWIMILRYKTHFWSFLTFPDLGTCTSSLTTYHELPELIFITLAEAIKVHVRSLGLSAFYNTIAPLVKSSCMEGQQKPKLHGYVNFGTYFSCSREFDWSSTWSFPNANLNHKVGGHGWTNKTQCACHPAIRWISLNRYEYVGANITIPEWPSKSSRNRL